MKGVHKHGKRWIAQYGDVSKNGFRQSFSTYDQAVSKRKEWEKRYGDTESLKHHNYLNKDLTGKKFGNVLVVGLTGQTKNHEREYLCKDVITEKYFTANASPLKRGQIDHLFIWQRHSEKTYGISKRKTKHGYKWQAKIWFRRKKAYVLGTFSNKSEAIKIRKEAEQAILDKRFDEFIKQLGGN